MPAHRNNCVVHPPSPCRCEALEQRCKGLEEVEAELNRQLAASQEEGTKLKASVHVPGGAFSGACCRSSTQCRGPCRCLGASVKKREAQRRGLLHKAFATRAPSGVRSHFLLHHTLPQPLAAGAGGEPGCRGAPSTTAALPLPAGAAAGGQPEPAAASEPPGIGAAVQCRVV